jgi:hypothetical protein
MANIRENSAPNDLGLRPDDRAQESLANSGRRIAALYDTAADAKNSMGRSAKSAIEDVGGVVVKYAEHQEISKTAAESAKTLAGLDEQWNATVSKADPNDPSVAAKFREETLEPTLEKLGGSPITEGGQKFAEAQVERFRNHFYEKTSADMARLAGAAAKQNIETLTNQLSNAAISDPTSLKTSLGMVEHSIGAMVDSSPNLRGVDAAKMKLELTSASQTAIVKSAAIGAIALNPEAGLKQFSGPEYSKYISGVELRQLEQQAKVVQRAQRTDDESRLKIQKMQTQDASDNREGEYLQKLHSGDLKDRTTVTAKAIANDFTLTREARERMISMVERENKPETDAQVSRQTSVELFNWMRAQDGGDPVKMKNKIDDAYAAGRLTWGDRNALAKEVEDRKTPEGLALAQDRGQFFKQYAGAIAGTGYDPLMGSPKLYTAERDARRMEQDLRAKGLDPHLAYDPTSEYFLGKRVQKWRGSMQGDLDTKANPPKREDVMPAVPPVDQRSPGLYETPKGTLRWTGTGWIKP